MLRVEPQLIETFVATGEVKLAFHHVLDHGAGSEMAAMAAECAGSQDPWMFWRMHNHMFTHQRALFRATADTYSEFADELGLDTVAFGSCMADRVYLDKVKAMDALRRDQGIRQRPSFWINERLVTGGISLATFATVIQQEATPQ